MELSTFLEIVIAVIGAVIITLIASWIANKLSKNSNIGCSVGIIGGIIIFIVLNIISTNIIEVYDNNGKLDYKKRDYLGEFEQDLPNGEKIKLKKGDRYIVNKSDEILIFYPEYYGDSYSSTSNDNPTIIAPQSIVNIKNFPNYYFEPAPSSIRSKSKSETKWVLESFKEYGNREGYDLNDLNLDLEEINNLQ